MTRKASTSLAGLLVLVFSLVSVQLPAQAALISTEQLAAEATLAAERDLLTERLLRDDVKAELLALGVSADAVQERIDSLSHAELAEINGKLATLPAGGNGLGTVAVVLLILILLEITGAIDIFPRI
jgi:hypothetical protein